MTFQHKTKLSVPAQRAAFRQQLEALQGWVWTPKAEQYCEYRLDGRPAGAKSAVWLRAKQYTNGTLFLEASEEGGLGFLTGLLPPSLQPAPAVVASPMPPVPAAAALRGTVIGTDEAGKGDYFGPLVIAAVAVTPDVATPLSRLGVIDSKQLSDAKMCVLARQIEDMLGTDCCSVVAIGPPNYNAWYEALRARGEHLNHLMAWGHAEVVARILQAQPHLATLETTMLTDQFGNARYVANQVKERGLGVRLVQQPRAESAHVAVAAASILARVRFVAAVAQLSEMVGQTLPLGAGPPVLAAGRKLVARQGVEVLSRVAKCHFKTTMAITA